MSYQHQVQMCEVEDETAWSLTQAFVIVDG